MDDSLNPKRRLFVLALLFGLTIVLISTALTVLCQHHVLRTATVEIFNYGTHPDRLL